MELQAKCFTHAITCRWVPRTRAAPISPSRWGSSPNVSCARPHAGWRSRFTHTPANRLAPSARHSTPMTSPTRSSRSGSNVAPRAMGTGKAVAWPMTTPRGPSLNRMPGRPRRGSAPATYAVSL